MPKLISYKKFAGKKDGKQYCVATVTSELTAVDKQNGYVGCKVEELFMPENLVNLFKPEDIGHEVVCDYNISGGRAFLTNVTVK